jgi:hypothetical protein
LKSKRTEKNALVGHAAVAEGNGTGGVEGDAKVEPVGGGSISKD